MTSITLFAKTIGFKATKQTSNNGKLICCLDITTADAKGTQTNITCHLDQTTLDGLLKGLAIDFKDYRNQPEQGN